MASVTSPVESASEAAQIVHRLIGVYNAAGTVRGELTYWIGARLGRAHCSLCDITHGLVRERDDWRNCRNKLAVPFDTYHLNDQPQQIRRLNSAAPVVVAETSGGVTVLLGPDEIAVCDGSPERFVREIERAVAATGLRWS